MEKKVVIFEWEALLCISLLLRIMINKLLLEQLEVLILHSPDNDAWSIYINALADENGVFISRQNDDDSKSKLIERLNSSEGLNTTVLEFSNIFIMEHLNVCYYKKLVDYIHSLRKKCKIGIFSDLIFCCLPILDKQFDLDKFDYIWLSFLTHFRKNDELAFEIVENDLEILPENILFIDDTSINIENAKNRGWNTCQAFGYEFYKIKNSIDRFLIIDLEEQKVRKK